MKYLIFLLTLFIAQNNFAQNYSLKSLIDSAVQNYPTFKLYEINNQINSLQAENIKFENYPDFDLNAKAQWQSEVMNLNIDFPPQIDIELPQISNDQYNLSLNIQQAIYKGGVSKTQKEIANIDKQINDANTTNELYQIKIRVVNLYYQAIFIDKQNEILKKHQNTINKKLEEINSLVENGVILKLNANKLQIELINIENAFTENKYAKMKVIASLNKICGLNISEDIYF